MKFKIILLLSNLFCCYFLGLAQEKKEAKLFLDKQDQMTDSVNAKSYLIVHEKKEGDSVYRAEQYSMDSFLILKGGFADANLSVAHGEYSYYAIHRENKKGDWSLEKIKNTNYVDTSYRHPVSHFLEKKGLFLNGKQNGRWVTYYKDGTVKQIENFKDDSLEGKYQSFHSNGGVLAEGNYQNNEKNGIWKEFDGLSTFIYADGKLVKKTINKEKADSIQNAQKTMFKYYRPAHPQGNFVADLRKMMASSNVNEIQNEIIKVSFIVNEKGAVSNVNIYGSSDFTLNDKIKEFISNSIWYPATNGKDKKPVVSPITYNLVY